MSFNPQRLKKAYYSFSSIFKQQSAFDTPLADADLDERHNCTVEFVDVIERETIYDCEQSDIFDEQKLSQLKRVTLNYASITPQRLYGWLAMFLSASAAPTGTSQNEVQTVTQADADGGAAAWTFAYEGKTGTTATLAWDISTANLKAALEALASIGEGNITSITGSLTAGFVITFGGDLAKADLPLITIGAGYTDGGSPVAASVVQTTAGGNKYHAATRSTEDALAKTSIGCGYDSATAADPEKFYNQVVESVAITLNRRKNVSAVITLLGRFTPDQMTGYSVPDCENLPALKGRHCKVKINGTYIFDEFWSATITLNNAVPTGDDAFPFDDIEVGTLERGDKPTYPISMQILGSEGDTIGELCRNETKVPIEFLMGLPGNRASLIFPNAMMKFQSNPRPYVGELNQSAHGIDAMPHKDDAIQSPLRAEAYLDQTTAFLTT